MNNSLHILGALLCLLIGVRGLKAQNFNYSNEPLLTVIEDIEQKTEYRFLYREAFISDIRVSFKATEPSLMSELSRNLESQTVNLRVDEQRKQVLIFQNKNKQASRSLSVSGFVLDSHTGERLPFSTISWRNNGELNGITANPDGTFSFRLSSGARQITLLVSFVGYEPLRVPLSFAEYESLENVAIRLEPEPYSGKEIVVQGINFYTASDTVMESLIKVGTFSPLGESNAVRSLQMLPSVSMSSALSSGLNIRGSSPDGFQILLDGQTIYHQSHLFGLLDAMNPEVLKTSGFYYDITPAQFQAPLGGTLSLITRTGSLNELHGSAGLSNTAATGTIEGPIIKGRASWLLSGRISYLDELNWMNNQKLVEFGLDVNRPSHIDPRIDIPQAIVRNVSQNLIEVEQTDARFYDLHGKAYFETKKGSQFSLSGYIGHDNALQDYYRDEVETVNLYTTQNYWDTQALSGSFTTQVGDTRSETRLGVSHFESEVSKDDFEYQFRPEDNRRGEPLLANLTLQNKLDQFDARQTFSTDFDGFSMEYGINYSDFDVEYREYSVARSSFQSRRTSQLVDIFHQLDIQTISDFNLFIGNRIHYFSNGRYLRWSPRVKVNLFPENRVSFSAGFSRNYQFINRLQFYNINSTDFWILTNKDQPPSSVNYFSSGVHFNLHENIYLQAEGYYKQYNYLRFHELNTGLISESFSNEDAPWFYDNDGRGKGIEFLMRNRFNRINITSSYTLSSMEIQNDQINGGEYFYADWDRRHQFSFVTGISLVKKLDLFISWMYGSGTPNKFDILRYVETPREPYYSRVDATINYNTALAFGMLKASVSVYNLLNRNNPWYSEYRQITVDTRNGRQRANARTNIFDLGIQPSFNLSFQF